MSPREPQSIEGNSSFFRIDDDVPETLLCPITRELFTDPVLAPDGHVYERTALEGWLKREGTSPLTREEMRADDLRRALDVLTEVKRYNSWAASAAPATPFRLRDGSSLLSTKKEGDLPISEAPFDLKVTKQWKDNNVLLRLSADLPKEGRRKQTICCLVDVSGSMGMPAGNSPGAENVSYSKLDIVKHTLKTVVSSLGDNDKFLLVAFHSEAAILSPSMKTNEANKKKIFTSIDSLLPCGGTNIWGGLEAALSSLEKEKEDGALRTIFLLSDGNTTFGTTEEPEELQRYKEEKSKSWKVPAIHTFAFGNDVDASKMQRIANTGRGTYNFISDGTMVGTVISHTLSQILLAVATNVTIALEGLPIEDKAASSLTEEPSRLLEWTTSKEQSLLEVPSVDYYDAKERFLTIKVPALTLSHELDFVIPLQPDVTEAYVDCTITISYATATSKASVSIEEQTYTFSHLPLIETSADVEYHSTRIRCSRLLSSFAKLTHPLADSLGQARKNLSSCREELRASSLLLYHKDPRALDLLKDLTGEVELALSEQYYSLWGNLYLLSYSEALFYQRRNNFKDKGISRFGGKDFQRMRDHIRSVFAKIPPPRPSLGGYAPSSMAMYDNPRGSCFTGDSLVALADGPSFLKRAEDVVKGDRVRTEDGGSDEVETVVVSVMESKERKMVRINRSLALTPWHPVRIGGKWRFPAELTEEIVAEGCKHNDQNKEVGEKEEGMAEKLSEENDEEVGKRGSSSSFFKGVMEVERVFSFVLRERGLMVIGGLPVATLGHGLEGDVIGHPFFGTEKVVDALRQCDGFEEGRVVLTESSFLRSSPTGVIDTIAPQKKGGAARPAFAIETTSAL